MPVFVVNPHAGLLIRGNIDLLKQPVVKNRDGTYSTVSSASFQIEFPGRPKGAQVLLPTVTATGHLGFAATFDRYRKDGRHLGILDTPAHASAYSDAIHQWYVRNAKLFLQKQQAARVH